MNSKIINPSPLVVQFESMVPCGSALDIGSGHGSNSLFLARKGFEVTALDIKNDPLEFLEKKSKEEDLQIETVNRNINGFDVENSKYSFVVAINSLNFLSKKEFISVIEKIKRGLKSGGICVISLFTVEDSLFDDVRYKMKSDDGESFYNEQGKKWYFLRPNELRELFEKDFEILFYKEAIVDDKGHPGKEKLHQHAIARIVIKK